MPNSFDERHNIEYFQMGSNIWKPEDYWPPDESNEKLFYLAPGGMLSETNPVENVYVDSFDYNPRDPSPTIGGATVHPGLLHGPHDQAIEVESRNDIIIFTTPIQQNDLHIIGKLKVNLYVSSDRLDTDFAIRITDVYPDGRSMLIADGIRRMRFRRGFKPEDEEFMTPGDIYPVEILSQNTAITILAGHRLRLEITSSNYPRYDNNLNNGSELYMEGDTLIAHNKIYFGASYPSALSVMRIESVTDIRQTSQSLPEDFELQQNFPNPFNPITIINYQLPVDSHVELDVFNILGQKVCMLLKAKKQAGTYSVKWHGSDDFGNKVASGVYLYRMKADKFVKNHKMLLLP